MRNKHQAHSPARAGGSFLIRYQLALVCGLFSILYTSYLNCHSGAGRNLMAALQKIPTFVGMTLLLLFSPPLHAEETFNEVLAETALNENEVRYAPSDCDFEMIFPSQPYVAQRCPRNDNGTQKSCYPLTGYTYVYDVTTTVDITVTCVASSPKDYDTYSTAVIKTALRGMLNKNNIENAEVNSREKEGHRIGSLLGSMQQGRQNGIYNAQLWVGENSIMTIEAKLLGPSHPKADIAFGDILSSVKVKD